MNHQQPYESVHSGYPAKRLDFNYGGPQRVITTERVDPVSGEVTQKSLCVSLDTVGDRVYLRFKNGELADKFEAEDDYVASFSFEEMFAIIDVSRGLAMDAKRNRDDSVSVKSG